MYKFGDFEMGLCLLDGNIVARFTTIDQVILANDYDRLGNCVARENVLLLLDLDLLVIFDN
jgi:hypothetical protein